MEKERRVGTVSRGIRCPIIREGDDLAKIVADSVIEADVDVTELMGNEIFLYLKSGEDVNLTARVSARSTTRAGDKIKVALDVSRVHIFDKDTERCIIH